MYAKLASHSLAPTPDRVDARDCGTSFEKVADIINVRSITEKAEMSIPMTAGSAAKGRIFEVTKV